MNRIRKTSREDAFTDLLEELAGDPVRKSGEWLARLVDCNTASPSACAG